jgi:hypothetical protein
MPGDLFELLSALDGSVDPFWAGSCSALIKVHYKIKKIHISSGE